jgi:dipeptidase
MNKLGFFFALAILLGWWAAPDGLESTVCACFAVIVGRKASADGSVLIGHNEQNPGRRVLHFSRLPRQRFDDGAVVRLQHGGQLPQVKQTLGFLWSECPGLERGDNYLNDRGVAVMSNQCRTREDDYKTLVRRGEIRDGGIGYMLRRLVAERARTAREGVELLGRLVERFGYVYSGRTYIIADCREAWLAAVVRGRRWVAQRVPDDAVVVLPNIHIITEVDLDEVDLDDGENFLGSADLIDYAVGRGWYNPKGPRPFSFRKVYRKKRRDLPDPRRWWGHRLVTGRRIAWPPKPPFPFAIKPAEKMTIASVATILRNRGGRKIISDRTTMEGAVLQLREHMPTPIGTVYWQIVAEPSTSVLTPWYLGVTHTPKCYYGDADTPTRLSLDHHFNPPEGTLDVNLDLAWWKFKTLENLIHKDYDRRIKIVRPVWAEIEDRVLRDQQAVEKKAIRFWKTDPPAARAYLTHYCDRLALAACQEADRLAELLCRTG